MKQCEEYELAISCYVDGELEPAECPILFDHLSTCGRCVEFLGRMVQVRIDAARQPRATVLDRSAAQRLPIPQYGGRPHVGFRASTIALLLFSLLMFGVLFSATIEVQPPVENKSATTITP